LAYDTVLAERIRPLLTGLASVTEKKMFGGIGFLVNGNMACGVHGTSLIVRVDPADYEHLLQSPVVRHFDLTGRPMRGWITVLPDGYASAGDLKKWVARGTDYTKTLPSK
jgi:hypothetical protein